MTNARGELGSLLFPGLEEGVVGDMRRGEETVVLAFLGPTRTNPSRGRPSGLVRQWQPRPNQGLKDTHRWLSQFCPEPGY